MHSLSNPPTPSTTESATNRIDLDSLSAALRTAGFDVYTERDSYVDLRWSPVSDDSDLTVFSDGELYIGFVTPDERVWTALDIIRAHTAPTPARSHAAGTPGEGV